MLFYNNTFNENTKDIYCVTTTIKYCFDVLVSESIVKIKYYQS